QRLKSTEAFIILTLTNNLTQQVVYNKYPLLNFDNGKPFQVIFRAPFTAGSYRYQFSIAAKQHVGVGYNSNIYKVTVN
ncbi:MAG TPA: hypothetical protein VNW51_02770, partial [Mucilaginibacter sp.]|nr:hypothetical protein [Mucilaginibacter sp.]